MKCFLYHKHTDFLKEMEKMFYRYSDSGLWGCLGKQSDEGQCSAAVLTGARGEGLGGAIHGRQTCKEKSELTLPVPGVAAGKHAGFPQCWKPQWLAPSWWPRRACNLLDVISATQ